MEGMERGSIFEAGVLAAMRLNQALISSSVMPAKSWRRLVKQNAMRRAMRNLTFLECFFFWRSFMLALS